MHSVPTLGARRGILFLCLLILTASPVAAQPGTASYEVRFDATWTADTHPQNYPPDPHFSGLVGGTHSALADFWEDGQTASLGMQRMAEWGSQTELVNEVQAAITAGTAEFVVTTAPLWSVPGSLGTTFTISEDHSLVTLVCMVAPSPDWFVGVDGLDLRQGGGWADEIVVDLYAWDGGTDSGANYTSPDQSTVPHLPIQAIDGAPFTPGVPLGTMTFTRQAVATVPPAAESLVRVWPNPFNPRTTVAWEGAGSGPVRVTVHDLAGRRVRVLQAEEAAAGTGSVDWDGRDSAGRSLPSALYVITVEGPGIRARRSVTLLK